MPKPAPTKRPVNWSSCREKWPDFPRRRRGTGGRRYRTAGSWRSSLWIPWLWNSSIHAVSSRSTPSVNGLSGEAWLGIDVSVESSRSEVGRRNLFRVRGIIGAGHQGLEPLLAKREFDDVHPLVAPSECAAGLMRRFLEKLPETDLARVGPDVGVLCITLLAFNWESHGYHLKGHWCKSPAIWWTCLRDLPRGVDPTATSRGRHCRGETVL